MDRAPDFPYTLIQQSRNYLAFLMRSGNQHSIHSPFLYGFYLEVIRGRTRGEGIRRALSYRNARLADRTRVKYLPAGTSAGRERTVSLASVARREATGLRKGKLLYRLAQYLEPSSMLELGTHLGIGAMFLSCGCPGAGLTSLEGSGTLLRLILERQPFLQEGNIRILPGMFDETLPLALESGPPPGLVWFDGDHRAEPTLRYFHRCLEKSNNRSVFVFDDIHWSPGMEQAWKEICDHPAVTLSVDLFRLGLVFFRKESSKQHFRLRW